MDKWRVVRHPGGKGRWRILLETKDETAARELYEQEQARFKRGSLVLYRNQNNVVLMKADANFRDTKNV